MSIWVEEEDIISRWGASADKPQKGNAQLLAFIDDAEDILMDKIPDLDSLITDGEIRVTTIKRVLSNAVIRAIKVGHNYYSQYSQTTGPFSQSASISSSTPKKVTLTDDEIAEIYSGSEVRGSIGSLTVNPSAGYYPYRDAYYWFG